MAQISAAIPAYFEQNDQQWLYYLKLGGISPPRVKSPSPAQWRGIPASDFATHSAQRIPPRPQLWLFASQ